MSLFMYVCSYVCMFTSVCTFMHVDVCACVFMHASVFMCVHACSCMVNRSVFMHAHVSVFIHINACICMVTHVLECSCMFACSYVPANSCVIFVPACLCVFICVHACSIHICVCVCMCCWERDFSQVRTSSLQHRWGSGRCPVPQGMLGRSKDLPGAVHAGTAGTMAMHCMQGCLAGMDGHDGAGHAGLCTQSSMVAVTVLMQQCMLV